MKDEALLEIVKKRGVAGWNEWRSQHPGFTPDLHRAALLDLFRGDARKTKKGHRLNLANLNLSGADLSRSFLEYAILDGADLRDANLDSASLADASLIGAHLDRAILRDSNLRRTRLMRAHFPDANLMYAQLNGADLSGANLSRANIYGISAWNVTVSDDTIQSNLTITRPNEPTITVDNLEIAQFIYLLLNNEKVRGVLDAITSKVVLILGRFSDERKAVLNAIRDELRLRDFTPILFDFDKPVSKDVTGTVETLARMSRFIIADLTDPSSIPHELATIVPFLRTTPVLPLRLAGARGYTMFDDLRAYGWVLNTHEYADLESLISTLPGVIAPADEKAKELRRET